MRLQLTCPAGGFRCWHVCVFVPVVTKGKTSQRSKWKLPGEKVRRYFAFVQKKKLFVSKAQSLRVVPAQEGRPGCGSTFLAPCTAD